MIYVIYASHIKKSSRFINTKLLSFFFLDGGRKTRTIFCKPVINLTRIAKRVRLFKDSGK